MALRKKTKRAAFTTRLLFIIKDYNGAAALLTQAHSIYQEDQEDQEVLLNLGISLARSQSHQKSIQHLSEYLKKTQKIILPGNL